MSSRGTRERVDQAPGRTRHGNARDTRDARLPRPPKPRSNDHGIHRGHEALRLDPLEHHPREARGERSLGPLSACTRRLQLDAPLRRDPANEGPHQRAAHLTVGAELRVERQRLPLRRSGLKRQAARRGVETDDKCEGVLVGRG